jgi:DnaJ-class molecular chaperone
MTALKPCGKCHGKGSLAFLFFRWECSRCGGLGQELKLSARLWARFSHSASEGG